MIRKYVFGSPFPTEAVVEEVEEGKGGLPFTVERDGEGLLFRCPLGKKDIVYGLGETMRGVNKRGGRYVSYNTDDMHHRDDMPSLYGSHNFIAIDGKRPFGAFFDTPARAVFEIDYKDSGEIVVETSSDVCVYLVEACSPYAVAREFLRAIGRSYLPPLWAFGYGQSRWGYQSESDLDEVVKGYEEADIPLEYLCMDIDYMDRFMDFTVNKERFPDLAAYSAKLKEKGIRLVPIIDAGVKIEADYSVYEEGVKNGYFCTNKEGKEFRVAVWPGMTHFPDFFQPKAREWFGQKYKILTDCGIEGFWNDMNEPAIFYSEYTSPNDAANADCTEEEISNAYVDYKNFYHKIDGQTVLHHDVHNLYGALMTRAAGEQLDKLLDKRFMLFSRSSYIGAHRYGGIWTGDNASCWEHLQRNVTQAPSLNLCGFLFSGADTGGFGGNTTRELLLRWLAVSAFTPLMRNHTIVDSLPQECYRFEKTEDFKSIIDFRYKILPYLYSEYMKAALSYDMLIKPVAFSYPDDERAKTIEDQLLVGDSLMMTPVLKEGETEREVYLPEDMTEVKYDGKNFLCSPAKRGIATITAELNEIVFFIRKGKLVPVGKGAKNTKSLDLSDVVLLGDGESYEQYLDDGFTKDYENNIRILKK